MDELPASDYEMEETDSVDRLSSDVDLWVRVEYIPDWLEWEDDAVTRSKKDIYWAPQCLSSCSSVKKLSIVGCNLRIHGSPHWNRLKSLRIDGFCFSECLINRVLSGAPQLEVFSLRLLESYENLNIRSRSLKKLTIEKYLFFYDSGLPSTDTELRISCPNLETLEISGLLYSMCLLTNVSPLTEATLGFSGSRCYDNGEELLGETLRQILSTIRHVERVTLSDWCVQVLGVMEKKYLLSQLWNVKFLKLDVCLIELDQWWIFLGSSLS